MPAQAGRHGRLQGQVHQGAGTAAQEGLPGGRVRLVQARCELLADQGSVQEVFLSRSPETTASVIAFDEAPDRTHELRVERQVGISVGRQVGGAVLRRLLQHVVHALDEFEARPRRSVA